MLEQYISLLIIYNSWKEIVMIYIYIVPNLCDIIYKMSSGPLVILIQLRNMAYVILVTQI